MKYFCAMRVLNPDALSSQKLKLCGLELNEDFDCPTHGSNNVDGRDYSQALREMVTNADNRRIL